jgi:hypothetical protein
MILFLNNRFFNTDEITHGNYDEASGKLWLNFKMPVTVTGKFTLSVPITKEQFAAALQKGGVGIAEILYQEQNMQQNGYGHQPPPQQQPTYSYPQRQQQQQQRPPDNNSVF